MSAYPITKVLEEICRRPETTWSRCCDSSIVITYKDRTFRIAAVVYEDTETALLSVREDEPEGTE